VTDLPRVAEGLVGRGRELDLILAAVAAGRDVVLEGPPGTSKSTILRAITQAWGIPLLLVEGNAELTPAKLLGHHNPARVLREDYSADNFVAGPLVAAMQQGGFLYIEEFNRAPEDTLNTLLGAMAEREVAIPRVGRIAAASTFRLVASMNPYDNVGTMRISASVYDRLCRLAVGYQDAEEEAGIVALRTASGDRRLIADAVALTRATRVHPAVRQGASVRGAIDLVLVAQQLAAIRDGAADHPRLVLDAALLALSGRIGMDETTDLTPEHLITQLWEDHFFLRPRRAAPGPHIIDVENPIKLPGRVPPGAPARLQPLARKPKALDEAPALYRASSKGALVLETGGTGREAAGQATQDAAQGWVATREHGERERLEDLLEGREPDPEVTRMAHRIARRLAVRRRPRDRVVGRGRGRLASVPYRYNSDDIDLDRTLEMLTERPVPDDTDIIVRERMLTHRAIVLLGDVSGSMRGEKTRMAAATIAALASDLADDELAVIAFWKNAALLKPIDRGAGTGRLLTDLLRIPARGLTNVTFALETGLAELARATARQRIGVLLSDAVHNAGPDPRDVARRYERLHVLLEADGEHDAALAADLARLGHGELVMVTSYTEVAGALNHLLGR
jgi:MoxR-like ATPase